MGGTDLEGGLGGVGPLVVVRLDGGKGPHTEDLRRRASDGHRTVLS